MFAGAGVVARACADLGRLAFIIDLAWNPKCDACSKSFRDAFERAARQRSLGGVMLATPCSNFSLSISRSGRALRSLTHPRGIPKPRTQSERARVAEGNKALDATIQMVSFSNRFSIPFALENPSSSYLWKDLRLQRVLEGAFSAKIHQCAFGALWRKSTTIAFNFCER